MSLHTILGIALGLTSIAVLATGIITTKIKHHSETGWWWDMITDDPRLPELIDEMARSIAEVMNGGKFDEAKWYNETAKANWRKAVEPWAEEVWLYRYTNPYEDAER